MLNNPHALRDNLRDEKNTIVDETSSTINIIDDYNIQLFEKRKYKKKKQEETDETVDNPIEFYKDEFKDTKVKTIRIYHQLKDTDEENLKQFNKHCEIYGCDACKIRAFLSAIGQPVTVFFKEVDKPYALERTIDKRLNNMYEFMKALQSIGICVSFNHYDQNELRTPLHGRYWISEKGGYIVDGSLDTIQKSIVIVQKMDPPNFTIINGIFREEIESQTTYPAINLESVGMLATIVTEHIKMINRKYYGYEGGTRTPRM